MKAQPVGKVDFTHPPRVGHLPGVMDGKSYRGGWMWRIANGDRKAFDIHDDTESWHAGWYDADNAIRLGRDIGQRSEQ